MSCSVAHLHPTASAVQSSREPDASLIDDERQSRRKSTGEDPRVIKKGVSKWTEVPPTSLAAEPQDSTASFTSRSKRVLKGHSPRCKLHRRTFSTTVHLVMWFLFVHVLNHSEESVSDHSVISLKGAWIKHTVLIQLYTDADVCRHVYLYLIDFIQTVVCVKICKGLITV